MSGDAIRIQVFYSGRVQGVGFRATTAWIARTHAVTGFVRNLPDGRVELVVEATASEAERFLAAVAEAFAGKISLAERQSAAAMGRYSSFEITM